MRSRRRRIQRKRKKNRKGFIKLDQWVKKEKQNPKSFVSVMSQFIDDLCEDSIRSVAE